MKDIKDLVVTQIKIFPADYIQYGYLMRPDFIDFLVKKYKFEEQKTPFNFYSPGEPKLLIFRGGEFNFENNKIIIHTFQFEDRKIILEVTGSSKAAKNIFEALEKDIRDFDPSKSFKIEDASFHSETTFCIVTLDVNFMDIYSKKFKEFINNNFASRLKNDYLNIFPKVMRFEVEFKPDLKLLQNESITLSPKTITIEPRGKSGIKKKVFQTESPFDSDTHLKLLEDFEKMFRTKQ